MTEPKKPAEISSGALIPPGKSKILLMVEEENRKIALARKRLKRIIQIRQMEEQGLLPGGDAFGDDENSI